MEDYWQCTLEWEADSGIQTPRMQNISIKKSSLLNSRNQTNWGLK